MSFHAPVITKVLHVLADFPSEAADELGNFGWLGSISQRASAADPSDCL